MFRTELTIAPATGQLTRTARVLTMGSCFADSIGTRLVSNKIEARVNPFGTVFQPLALARLLRAAAGEDVDWQRHLVQARGRWQSYDLHGSIGADSPVELLQHIQDLVRQTGEFLRNTDVVLLTLGTAWAYRLRETGELVSNCHKQSSDLFVRELLTPDEIINALAETHAYLRRINPELRFVLTVSPVRHLKDTLPLNSVSKSVLRLATHIVSDLLPGVAYFPAYELLMDDLRDYRFYAADMLHPSEVAEDYIWEKFARTYFDADFGRFRKEWAAVRQSLGHRPLHEGAPEHRQFLESTREKLEQMSLRKVDVADELRTVQTRIAALPEPLQPQAAADLDDDEERIDIGEGSVASIATRVAPTGEAATAETQQSANDNASSRPPRLSPEEFRAQRTGRSDRPERGRRDGRGKGQVASLTETEAFQAASFGEADEFAQQPFLGDKDSAPAELTPMAVAPEATIGAPVSEQDADDQEPGRKKKRRSRGGAKRTARKHALRLAAESEVDESQLPASEAALEAATGALPNEAGGRSDAQKSSVITKSQPVKRGGRRNEPGRVPRVELFAAPAADGAFVTQASAIQTEVPALIDFDSTMDAPQVVSSNAEADLTASSAPSRNSRNRNKKKARKQTADTNAAGSIESGTSGLEMNHSSPVAGSEQLAAPRESEPAVESQRGNTRQSQETVAALPVSGQAMAAVSAVAADAADTGEAPVAKPAPAKRTGRKSRAAIGGRAEKPAIDTPVIPVIDPTIVRTQVAAGRMMGSSATLIAQTPTPKAAATKAVVSKAAVAKVVAPVAPKAAVAKTAAPKAKPAKAAAVAPTAVLPSAPVAAVATPATTTPAPSASKRKPAAKAKAVAAPVSPVAQEPVAATKVAPVAAVKAKSAKTTPKPVAAAVENKVAEAAKVVSKKAAAKAAPKAAATKAAAPKKAVAKTEKAAKPAAKSAAKPSAKPKTPKKSA
ncbi:GSCFA domain-containing protein [Hymenobacter siberiensis]|uniref:GSCFA domain-containing protein n=1 Tax=Hymenobacter siberiensis TaxID=2848396 RepID=UPI001C1DE6E4|nr:GSCFA domain-containing protein [Hymenobacter siberiensis]